jgi:ethanolamine utilization protein EutA
VGHELGHDHGHAFDPDLDDGQADPDREAEIRDAIWATDNVELTTLGLDVGSATSHLMFSRIHLKRQGSEYSSRFVVVSRTTLHRSDILLTPYRADGRIDADELGRFVDDTYRDAGLGRDDVDAGAVILTGVALERSNARAIAELFAEEGGRFVCATAGHNLEALLAAHGSGAVERSRGEPVLNVDVGGGTTKLAWCDAGAVISTMAVAGGARLLAVDRDGRATRIEHDVATLARELGITLRLGEVVAAGDRRRLAEAIAARVAAAIDGTVDPSVVLAGERRDGSTPAVLVLSGGVAELIGSHDVADFGDLGAELAAALVAALERPGRIIEPSPERIRATVVGASQFSVQLSGNTVHVAGHVELPLHGIPVVGVDVPEAPMPDAGWIQASIERRSRQLDLDGRDEAIAIALGWDGEPAYENLRTLAEAIAAAHRAAPRRDRTLIVAALADIGASLGAILEDELGITGGVIAIDGLELADLDYIDIGEQILPANVVPVVVKSLVFPSHDAVGSPQIVGAA